jgi:hypothetical protein
MTVRFDLKFELVGEQPAGTSVATVVLAAGSSRRVRARHKLLLARRQG